MYLYNTLYWWSRPPHPLSSSLCTWAGQEFLLEQGFSSTTSWTGPLTRPKIWKYPVGGHLNYWVDISPENSYWPCPRRLWWSKEESTSWLKKHQILPQPILEKFLRSEHASSTSPFNVAQSTWKFYQCRPECGLTWTPLHPLKLLI